MTLRENIYTIVMKDSLAYSGLDNLFSYISKILNVPILNIKKEFNKLVENGDVFEMRTGKFIARVCKRAVYWKRKRLWVCSTWRKGRT